MMQDGSVPIILLNGASAACISPIAVVCANSFGRSDFLGFLTVEYFGKPNATVKYFRRDQNK